MQVFRRACKYFLLASKKYFMKHYTFLVLFLGLAIFLRFNPGIDLFISNLFYDGTAFKPTHPIALFAYHSVPYLTYALTFFLASTLLITFIKKNIKPFNLDRKAIIFLITFFLLAPLLLVDPIIKGTVCRARPVEVSDFGGDKRFTAPFELSKECDYNCSFPSGHASFAFSLMVFSYLFTPSKRRIVFSITFINGIIVSTGRIIHGRHFFSDTLFAFFFMALVMSYLYALFYPEDDISKIA